MNKIEIESYSEEHMPEIWRLWKTQYLEEFSATGILPNTWISSKREIEAFLKKESDSGFFAVAKREGEVVGYMLFRLPVPRGCNCVLPHYWSCREERNQKRSLRETLFIPF